MLHRFLSLLSLAWDKGLLHLLSSNFVVQFMGFGLILFLTKLLSPTELGELKLIQSYAAFFILLGSMGYNAAITKLCSESISDEQKKYDFSYAVYRSSLYSVLAFLCFILFSQFYVGSSNKILGHWMSAYALVIFFAVFGKCLLAYLQAKKMVKEAAQTQLFIRLLFVGIIFIAAIIWGYSGVIIATILSYVIGLLFFLPYVKSTDFFANRKNARAEKINKYSYFVFIGAIITLFSQYSDIYLLDYLGVDSQDIGYYSIATIFFMAGIVFTSTLQTVVTPYFSERQEDILWVRRKALTYQGWAGLISIVVTMGLLLVSWGLVNYYYGQEYSLTFDLTIILLVKFFLWANYSIIGACLFSIGVIKEGVWIAAICSCFSIVLGYLLYHKLGIAGVAWGQVASSILNLVLIYILFGIKTQSQEKRIA